MTDMTNDYRTGLRRRALRVAAALAVVMPIAACDVDNLLDIRDPDVADPTGLDDATALPSFLAAAIGDVGQAYDNDDGQITYSGMMADEFINSETFPTRIQIDIRNILFDNASLDGVTRNLYQGRTAAELAVAQYEKFNETDQDGYAESLGLAALTYVLFGENYCSGVPFSQQNEDGSFEYGGRETTEQIFERAIESTNAAIAAADAGSDELHFAAVLKGRALLNLNRPAEAAAAVAGVPTDFVYGFAHSENTARENNGVFVFNVLSERISVANSEGINGLPYRTAFTNGDPRTPWRRSPGNDTGFDRSTPQFDGLKYDSRSAFTPAATGVEARMIEAEAALRAGDFTTFIAMLNEPRGDAVGLPASLADVTDPGTEAGRIDLLFRERAFWMWMTSHRLGDLRRLIRQYGRAEDDVFPTGPYHKANQGGVYGDDVNLPLTV
ncbi:MAG: hypothetical protein ACRELT_04625, partial [Longimicrobiales bacterium]